MVSPKLRSLELELAALPPHGGTRIEPERAPPRGRPAEPQRAQIAREGFDASMPGASTNLPG
jgi:hypothetical protein